MVLDGDTLQLVSISVDGQPVPVRPWPAVLLESCSACLDFSLHSTSLTRLKDGCTALFGPLSSGPHARASKEYSTVWPMAVSVCRSLDID